MLAKRNTSKILMIYLSLFFILLVLICMTYDNAMCSASEWSGLYGLQRILHEVNATPGSTWGNMIEINPASTRGFIQYSCGSVILFGTTSKSAV